PGHRVHDERGAARGLADVVLEHDAAHAALLGERGDVDVVHAAAEDVRVRMHVEVDHADRGADFGRRRREGGLSERLGRSEGERKQKHFFHGSPPLGAQIIPREGVTGRRHPGGCLRRVFVTQCWFFGLFRRGTSLASSQNLRRNRRTAKERAMGVRLLPLTVAELCSHALELERDAAQRCKEYAARMRELEEPTFAKTFDAFYREELEEIAALEAASGPRRPAELSPWEYAWKLTYLPEAMETKPPLVPLNPREALQLTLLAT